MSIKNYYPIKVIIADNKEIKIIKSERDLPKSEFKILEMNVKMYDKNYILNLK
jgi:hypothetical protein